MSNYYYRDDDGNWFVHAGKEFIPIEFSGSMEIAYSMGKLAELDRLQEVNNGRFNIRTNELGDMPS